jgi:hypothetical protein
MIFVITGLGTDVPFQSLVTGQVYNSETAIFDTVEMFGRRNSNGTFRGNSEMCLSSASLFVLSVRLYTTTCSSELYLELRRQNELMCNITRIFAFHGCSRYDYKVSYQLLLTNE